MKIAKLEMKLILALFLLGYEYELVDGKGNYPKALPDQDRNDLLQVSALCIPGFSNLSSCLVATYGRTMLSEI